MTMQLKQVAKDYAILRERLKDAYGLSDDDQALIDTLDGESNFKELCVSALRMAKRKEAHANGLQGYIDDLKERKERLETSASRIRSAIADAMLDAGEAKFVEDDMTVSVRLGKTKLVIDQARLPSYYQKTITVFKPDPDRIQAAVDRGEVPEGVQINNPQPILTVRVK